MARSFQVRVVDDEERTVFAGTPAALLRLVFTTNGSHMVCGNCERELAEDLAAGLGRP